MLIIRLISIENDATCLLCFEGACGRVAPHPCLRESVPIIEAWDLTRILDGRSSQSGTVLKPLEGQFRSMGEGMKVRAIYPFICGHWPLYRLDDVAGWPLA